MRYSFVWVKGPLATFREYVSYPVEVTRDLSALAGGRCWVVDQAQQYTAAEMKRMMKVQDVLLKAMAKKITWWAAAEIIELTDRTMRRWRERPEEGGCAGLADRRKGRPSPRAIPVATVEKGLGLYQETYYDLNIRQFCEKLRDEHGIELSYTWVQQALQGAGLAAKRRKRGPHRRRRPRRPMTGMLLHIDGSKYRWLNDYRWYDLIVILDDANSKIYYAQLVEEESTRTMMAGLREVRDLPCMEFRTTVVVEVYRVFCPDCGIKMEKVPQLPSKAPFCW
jgi:transposase